jgi:AraC family transcriptional regulator
MAKELRRAAGPLSHGASPLVEGGMVADADHHRAVSGQALTDEQHARLGSVVRLLETAAQNLSCNQGEAYRFVAKATALLQAECELGRTGSQPAKPRDLLPAWKMKRVIAYVDANLGHPIRLKEIASLAKLSCSHFSRAFRRTSGEAFSSFVIRCRLERAEQLILLTDKPLSQIALDCGMADQSHLTKLFRRSYGMSPGRWRELQNGSDTFSPQLALGQELPVTCSSGLVRSVATTGHRQTWHVAS